MTLPVILALAAASVLFLGIFHSRGRGWWLLVVSILAIYWLQPALPIRGLDFWLPTTTLGLTLVLWAATASQPLARPRETLLTVGVMGLAVIGIAATRYAAPLLALTPSRPPEMGWVIAALAASALLALACARWLPGRPWIWTLAAALLLGAFLILKTEPLGRLLSGLLRRLSGQGAEFASALDLGWLGFSYIAFRLIHVLRDRASGRLPDLSLREFVVYVIFFPAVAAGPIDRAERFVTDLRAPAGVEAASIGAGLYRLAGGVFKKFVLADTLALVALNSVNAAQVTSAAWMWIVLYAYAFRLWLDFSGYTDIAIGLGRLVGVTLPENFRRPYFQPNLTQFWNNWHMTLAQWFRAYYFNPLTRALRARNWPVAPIIFVTQITTMALIGLWHGVTWNFALWGLWHGLGLFVHNRWVDALKGRPALFAGRPALQRAAGAFGWLFTFNYVALGWVWFALPSPELSWRVVQRLFGF